MKTIACKNQAKHFPGEAMLHSLKAKTLSNQ